MLEEHTWSWWRCWNILGAGGDGGTYLELLEMVEHTWSWWRCWRNILGVGGDVGGTYLELVEMLVEIFNVGSAICFFERMMSNGFHCKTNIETKWHYFMLQTVSLTL